MITKSQQKCDVVVVSDKRIVIYCTLYKSYSNERELMKN